VILLVLAATAGYPRETLILVAALMTHELAHLAAARGCGLTVERVDLYPFGGVAPVEGIESVDPPLVALTAIAGPLNNLLLLLLGYSLAASGRFDPQLMDFFFEVNTFLVVINLLPALPLDGGRLVQAYLRLRVGDRQALRILIFYGYGVSAALILAGATALLLGIPQPNFFILAFFVFVAAQREQTFRQHAYLRPLWRRAQELERDGSLPVMPLAAPGAMTLVTLLQRLGPRHYHIVWVLGDDLRPQGTLAEGDLLAAAMAGRHAETLGDILRAGGAAE
ncbi:MAG: site-2 protease family protein, partial [Thermaerobacterales bacterium]